MSFNPNPPRVDYITTPNQTLFPFNFKIFHELDLDVYHTTGGTTVLLLPTDYTVTINGDLGGTVTLTGIVTLQDDFIVLERSLSLDRVVEYQTNGDLLADTLNDDQDYQTYLIADTLSKFNTSISTPPGTPGFNGTLPPPVSEAYLRYAADGRSLENDTTPPTWRTETEVLRDETEVFKNETEVFRNGASLSATSAETAKDKAQKWADNPENVPVEAGRYSAFHWAKKAESSGVIAPIFPQDEGKKYVAKASGNEWGDGQADWNPAGVILTEGTTPKLSELSLVGVSPQATLYPDGSIKGITSNGSFVMHPNGIMEQWSGIRFMAFINVSNLAHTWTFPKAYGAFFPQVLVTLSLDAFNVNIRSSTPYVRQLGTTNATIGVAGSFVAGDELLGDAIVGYSIGRWK